MREFFGLKKTTLLLITASILPTLRAAQEKPAPQMKQWEQDVRKRVAKVEKLKALTAKYPLVLLHARNLAGGDGTYRQSAFSFIYETSDAKKHFNDVQVLFYGGTAKTFELNMVVGQQNLMADLGPAELEKNPNPQKISIDEAGVLSSDGEALEGHVYLERVRDSNGNNFYVVFQVVAVDSQSRYMAFIWRRLPGGTVVKAPPQPK